ncbi:SRPBCC family protein, partial [Methylobacterium sp. E-045]|uniref:SRPBCC family protein n=1 Tax=Methylobacterium sp. E-045 TaxID=2836575 RepID=UPI001FB94560
GPLPVKAYNATIAVHPKGSGSTVVWTATFDAAGMTDAEAKADIEGVYEQGLAGIAKDASP